MGNNSPNKKPVPRRPGAPVYCAQTTNRDYSDPFPLFAVICELDIVTAGGSLEILASAAFTNLPTNPGNFIFWINVDGLDVKGASIAAPNQVGAPFRNGSSILVGPPDLAFFAGLSPLAAGSHHVELRGAVDPAFPGTIISINAAAVPRQEHASLRAREV